MKWEYKTQNLASVQSMLDSEVIDWLNAHGAQGWELAAVAYVDKDERDQIFYFKRPLK
jgi:hypothetical protein